MGDGEPSDTPKSADGSLENATPQEIQKVGTLLVACCRSTEALLNQLALHVFLQTSSQPNPRGSMSSASFSMQLH